MRAYTLMMSIWMQVKGVPFGKKGNEKTITPYLRISTMAGVQLWMGCSFLRFPLSLAFSSCPFTDARGSDDTCVPAVQTLVSCLEHLCTYLPITLVYLPSRCSRAAHSYTGKGRSHLEFHHLWRGFFRSQKINVLSGRPDIYCCATRQFVSQMIFVWASTSGKY